MYQDILSLNNFIGWTMWLSEELEKGFRQEVQTYKEVEKVSNVQRIIYASPNYAELRRDNGYFVDKTAYIAKLEEIENPVFLRPRRFGKSFMCSILHHYYDLRYKSSFEALFCDTWIGQNPTGNQSQYVVLHLNFSSIEPGPTLVDIEKSFKHKCNQAIDVLRIQYAPLLDALPPIDLEAPASLNLSTLITYTEAMGWPRLYIIIDEYDNFANRLIVDHKDQLYSELTADGSFLKVFFKALKAGRENGAIANIYITGILPLTIDELASAFNVATFLTLDPTFEAMVGFTQEEVDLLLDEIFEQHQFPAYSRYEIGELIKSNYNGYHFVKPASDENSLPIYNTTILMYFLRYFTEHREVPKQLTDANLKTDIGWVRRLASTTPEIATEFVNQLILTETIPYNEPILTDQFSVAQFFERRFFPISFFYLGLLTRRDDFSLSFPNLNMQSIFLEYFNELHQLDASDSYSEAMQAFVRQPDLEALFRCYWEEYILQLPEVVFMKVNENFYRTTFYELCMRYLSRWFTWHLERSYPKGKSDLEFVGKQNEKFSGMHWIIEFKYYSNSAMRKEEINLSTFQALEDDITQVRGYASGLKREYPQAQISQFLIYCFGNRGFHIFQVESKV